MPAVPFYAFLYCVLNPPLQICDWRRNHEKLPLIIDIRKPDKRKMIAWLKMQLNPDRVQIGDAAFTENAHDECHAGLESVSGAH